jgi:hypothetical protein
MNFSIHKLFRWEFELPPLLFLFIGNFLPQKDKLWSTIRNNGVIIADVILIGAIIKEEDSIDLNQTGFNPISSMRGDCLFFNSKISFRQAVSTKTVVLYKHDYPQTFSH